MLHRHPFLGLFTLAYLGFVGWITLGPQPLDASNSGVIYSILSLFSRYESTQWIGYNELEFLANIGMFLPVGLFLVLLVGRRFWWLAVIMACLLTFGIETAQLYIPGRVSDPRDLVANSLGGFIGVLVGLLLSWPKARRIRRGKQMREKHLWEKQLQEKQLQEKQLWEKQLWEKQHRVNPEPLREAEPPTRVLTARVPAPNMQLENSQSIPRYSSGIVGRPFATGPIDSSNIRGGYVDSTFISAGPAKRSPLTDPAHVELTPTLR